MIALGLSFGYHDSALAVVQDGELVFASQEERFSRVRFDKNPPILAYNAAMQELSLSPSDIDVVAFYEDPVKKASRRLAGSLGRLEVDSPPIDPGRFITVAGGFAPRASVVYFDHHLTHAASAYYCSGFDTCAVLTIDGVGEWTTTGMYRASAGALNEVDSVSYPDSLGLFYASITAYLGFEVNSDEYKVMGLAAYGSSSLVQSLGNVLDVGNVQKERHFALDPAYFDFTGSGRMHTDALCDRLGFPPRDADSDLLTEHKDLAFAAQYLLTRAVINEASILARKTGERHLAYAGGVALNCAANSTLVRDAGFTQVFIQPAAGDAGGAVGAAMLASRSEGFPPLKSSLRTAELGRRFNNEHIRRWLDDVGWPFRWYASHVELVRAVSRLLLEGSVVGWFQGREEFGPRALGARSILADPRSTDMRDRVNRVIKRREDFRPFAPVVTEEQSRTLFDMDDQSSRFMLVTFDAITDKVGAVTHVDGTSRVQTVNADDNFLLHLLLQEFGKGSGVECLLNTSLNMRGEPIASSLDDAFACFLRSGLDALVLGSAVLLRGELPNEHFDPPDPNSSEHRQTTYTFA